MSNTDAEARIGRLRKSMWRPATDPQRDTIFDLVFSKDYIKNEKGVIRDPRGLVTSGDGDPGLPHLEVSTPDFFPRLVGTEF